MENATATTAKSAEQALKSAVHSPGLVTKKAPAFPPGLFVVL